MQLRDTGLGFGIVTIVLHWIGAMLIVAVLSLGLTAGRMDGGADKLRLLALHGSMGLIIFVLSAYRLGARARFHHPLPVGTASPIEMILGRSVALGLLVATLLLPVAGWIAMSAAGAGVTFFDVVALPAALGRDRDVETVAKLLHRLGAYAFMTGLALHIFGALKHHFVLRDDTLKRMLGKQVEL